MMTTFKQEQPKVARVSTVPFFVDNQLRGQLHYLIQEGFKVSAIASKGNWERLNQVVGLQCLIVNIARAPALLKDIKAIYELYKLFKLQDFDIVHSTTPKAGLVSAIAGRLALRKVVIHTFTGQTWATKTGISRLILKWIDKVILSLVTQAYADSESQKQFLIQEGVGSDKAISVLGEGSLAGVDLERFNHTHWIRKKASILSGLGLNESHFIMTFIGRVNQDKGIRELISAFSDLSIEYQHLHLLVIGPIEDKTLLSSTLPNLHIIGETQYPEKYLSISHLLCLPSYREGFGTVVLEAAAMKVPAIGTNIVGLKDAIQDKVTGLLVEPKNSGALKSGLETLINDTAYCQQLGQAAYTRCQQYYDVKLMAHLVANEYRELLNK